MPPDAAKCRCFDFHASTFCVGGLSFLVFICLVYPGEYSRSLFGDLADGTSRAPCNYYVHGWPWTFLERTVFDEPLYESCTPWVSPHCWLLFRGDERKFLALALIGDTLVALVGSFVVVAAFEFWRRRRRVIWQFRIVDVIPALFIMSAILAWWRMEYVESKNEQKHISALEQRGHSSLESYHGPVWLRRLIGSELDILFRTDSVVLHRCSRDEFAVILPHLESLNKLREVRIREKTPGSVNDAPLSQLRSLHKLRVLDVMHTAVDDSIVPELIKLTRLRRIDVGADVSPSGVTTLREKLPHCEVWETIPNDG